jgi:hypothetical protein
LNVLASSATSLVMSIGSTGAGEGCTKTEGVAESVGYSDAMVNVRRALVGVVKRSGRRHCSCDDKVERSMAMCHSRS